MGKLEYPGSKSHGKANREENHSGEKKRMGGYRRDRAVRSRKRKIRDLQDQVHDLFFKLKGRIFSPFSIRDGNLQ